MLARRRPVGRPMGRPMGPGTSPGSPMRRPMGIPLRCVFSLLTHFQHLGGLIWHPCAPLLRKICLARSCCLSKGASLCGRAYELLHNPETGVAQFLGCDSCSWFRCCAVYRAVFALSIAWFRRRAVVHGQRCCSLPTTASELNVSLWCF